MAIVPKRPGVPIVWLVIAHQSRQESTHSPLGLCAPVAIRPVTIEHVEEVIEHEGDLSARSRTQKSPGSIQ